MKPVIDEKISWFIYYKDEPSCHVDKSAGSKSMVQISKWKIYVCSAQIEIFMVEENKKVRQICRACIWACSRMAGKRRG